MNWGKTAHGLVLEEKKKIKERITKELQNLQAKIQEMQSKLQDVLKNQIKKKGVTK